MFYWPQKTAIVGLTRGPWGRNLHFKVERALGMSLSNAKQIGQICPIVPYHWLIHINLLYMTKITTT